MIEDNGIDYDGEYDELLRLQAQAAQGIGPLVEAQTLPKNLVCTLALRTHELSESQCNKLVEDAKLLINETLSSEYNGSDRHAGELSIHCATSNADELQATIREDKTLMDHFLTFTWLNTLNKESKKLWSI